MKTSIRISEIRALLTVLDARTRDREDIDAAEALVLHQQVRELARLTQRFAAQKVLGD